MVPKLAHAITGDSCVGDHDIIAYRLRCGWHFGMWKANLEVER